MTCETFFRDKTMTRDTKRRQRVKKGGGNTRDALDKRIWGGDTDTSKQNNMCPALHGNSNVKMPIGRWKQQKLAVWLFY